jgi:hypothetical protein
VAASFGRVPRPLRLVTGALGLAGMEGLATAIGGLGAGIYLMDQAMNKLSQSIEKQVQAQLKQAQTIPDLSKAFQTEMDRQSRIAGYGGPITSLPLLGKTGADLNRDRGGLLGYAFRAVGMKEPGWLQAVTNARPGGAPAAPTAGAQANITDAAARQFVADSPFEAYVYAMSGGPGSAAIMAELQKRKQTSLVQQQWAAQYGASGLAPVNVTVNSPIGDRNAIGLAAKAAIDARNRNNGQYIATSANRG